MRRSPTFFAPALDGVDLLVPSGSVGVRQTANGFPGRSSSEAEAGGNLLDSWRNEPDSVDPCVDLGDYQIVREVGRGGMGVVYEAHQKSLGRRVAIKVLPPSALLDGRQRKRFQHEAQTAAQLQHPHIVPVYSVGNERGIPFYVMRYVDGVDLGTVIEWFRGLSDIERTSPSTCEETERVSDLPDEAGNSGRFPVELREGPVSDGPGASAYHLWVARLGIKVCEALDHAHGMGVVHRDIKPANLLLDRQGTIWVTDFGLARLRGDVRLTLTGDLVGTIRYMSPEQASGRQVLLDDRTDVYSLGATLYELLVLRPAHDGRDVAELLRQIADQEPPSPRGIDSNLPRALETIVLKAMAKEPELRYGSAREMAEDLGRFLRDEPILARPPSLKDQALCWKRRHRQVFRAAGTLVLLGMIGVIGASAKLWQEMRQTQRALLMQSVQRQRAEKNLDLAMKALDEAYLQMAESTAVREALGADEASALLRRTLEFYERFTRENSNTPEVHQLNAQAHARAGDIHAELGEVEAAEKSYLRAIELLSNLKKQFPGTFRYAVDLSVAWNNLGVLLREAGRLDESLWSFRQSMRQLGPMLELAPGSSASLSRQSMVEHNLAIVLAALGDRKEARARLNSSLKLRTELVSAERDDPDLRNDLALTYMTLGGMERSQEDFDASVEAFKRATSLLEDLVADLPTRLDFHRNLARSLYNQAMVLSQSGRSAEAESGARRASRIQLALAREHPGLPGLQDDLALSACCLAHIQAATGHHQEAEASFREASDIWRMLSSLNRSVPGFKVRLSRVHMELAWLLRDQSRSNESIAELREALRFDQENPIIRNDLAWLLISHSATDPEKAQEAVQLAEQAIQSCPQVWAIWNTLGVALYHCGRYEDSRRAFERSMALGQGGTSYDWFYLSLIAGRQDQVGAAHHWYEKAVKGMAALPFFESDLTELRDMAAGALGQAPHHWREILDEPLSCDDETSLTAADGPPAPTCRSALGFGPTSVTSFTLQRSKFPATMKALGES